MWCHGDAVPPVTDYLQRLRASTRDMVAVLRPHDSNAMFAPTYPIQRRVVDVTPRTRNRREPTVGRT
jgi:hypothetical protein